MLRAAVCVLFFLEQAFLIGSAATGTPALFGSQRPEGTLSKLKSSTAPYQIALVYSEYDNAREGYFCAGSLIAPEWVLTAAHCLSTHAKPSDLKVAAGSVQLSQSRLTSVTGIVRHEGFDRNSMINDIALIKLANPIRDMEPVSLADFETERHALKSDPRATVSGWGSAAFHAKTVSNDLLHITAPVVSRRSCNKTYNGAVTDKMICAGERDTDVCAGDSGGGLVITYKGNLYLEGIVSWGEGCGDPKKPGVYTRVPSYLDWIKAHMN